MDDNAIKPKYPPYGKVLADRQRWDNKPMFVFVCLGGDAFLQAQAYNKDRDVSALVLIPGQNPKTLIWPVRSCTCIIKTDGRAPLAVVHSLAEQLIKNGAVLVALNATWEDITLPIGYYDLTQTSPKWVQTREVTRMLWRVEMKKLGKRDY